MASSPLKWGRCVACFGNDFDRSLQSKLVFAPPVSPPCTGRIYAFPARPSCRVFFGPGCSRKPGHPARGLLPTRKGWPFPLLRPLTQYTRLCRGVPALTGVMLLAYLRLSPGCWQHPRARHGTLERRRDAPDVARPPAWPGSPQPIPLQALTRTADSHAHTRHYVSGRGEGFG